MPELKYQVKGNDEWRQASPETGRAPTVKVRDKEDENDGNRNRMGRRSHITREKLTDSISNGMKRQEE